MKFFQQIDQKDGNFYMMMIGPLMNVPAPWNNYLICLWVSLSTKKTEKYDLKKI